MKKFFFYSTLFFVFGCQLNSQNKNENKKYKINKTDSEWKAQLPKMSYYVLRKAGTERAFSGSLNFNKKRVLMYVPDVKFLYMSLNINMILVLDGLPLIVE